MYFGTLSIDQFFFKKFLVERKNGGSKWVWTDNEKIVDTGVNSEKILKSGVKSIYQAGFILLKN